MLGNIKGPFNAGTLLHSLSPKTITGHWKLPRNNLKENEDFFTPVPTYLLTLYACNIKRTASLFTPLPKPTAEHK